jgi:hypothetical protein
MIILIGMMLLLYGILVLFIYPETEGRVAQRIYRSMLIALYSPVIVGITTLGMLVLLLGTKE